MSKPRGIEVSMSWRRVPVTVHIENQILTATQTFFTAASLIRGPCLEMNIKESYRMVS